MPWVDVVRKILTTTRLLGGDDEAPLNQAIDDLEERTDWLKLMQWSDPVELEDVGTSPVLALTIPWASVEAFGAFTFEVLIYQPRRAYSRLYLVAASGPSPQSGGSAPVPIAEVVNTTGSNLATLTASYNVAGLQLSMQMTSGTQDLSLRTRLIRSNEWT